MTHESQTVVITGASSGIGAAIARRFAREGYELLLLGRDEDRLKKVQSECKTLKTEILAFDLAEVSRFLPALEVKLSEMSLPAILVNNAGVFHQGLTEDTGDEVWQTQFQINLLSAVQLTRFFWPVFKKNRRGSVLNIASTLGVKPTPFTSAYSAMKAALINWTLALAQEGGPHGIRANCICPGIVDTPIHAFHHLPPAEKKAQAEQMLRFQLLHELGKPEDVAEAAYFLASDLSRWTTGASLHVDGGIHIK